MSIESAFSFKDINSIGLRLYLMTSFNLNHFVFQTQSHWGLELQNCEFGEDTIQFMAYIIQHYNVSSFPIYTQEQEKEMVELIQIWELTR